MSNVEIGSKWDQPRKSLWQCIKLNLEHRCEHSNGKLLKVRLEKWICSFSRKMSNSWIGSILRVSTIWHLSLSTLTSRLHHSSSVCFRADNVVFELIDLNWRTTLPCLLTQLLFRLFRLSQKRVFAKCILCIPCSLDCFLTLFLFISIYETIFHISVDHL